MSGETFEKVSSTLGEQVRFSDIHQALYKHCKLRESPVSYTWAWWDWKRARSKVFLSTLDTTHEKRYQALPSWLQHLHSRVGGGAGNGTSQWVFFHETMVWVNVLKHGCNSSFLCTQYQDGFIKAVHHTRVPTIHSDWRGCLRCANGRQGRSTHETKLLYTEKQASCKHLTNKMFTVAIWGDSNLIVLMIYMFRAIWEFAQSRDCVAHSQNPEIAFQSQDCVL